MDVKASLVDILKLEFTGALNSKRLKSRTSLVHNREKGLKVLEYGNVGIDATPQETQRNLH